MKIETKLKMTAEAETLKLQTKIKQQQDMIRKQQERLQVAEAGLIVGFFKKTANFLRAGRCLGSR